MSIVKNDLKEKQNMSEPNPIFQTCNPKGQQNPSK
jgi:hypothetical protein